MTVRSTGRVMLALLVVFVLAGCDGTRSAGATHHGVVGSASSPRTTSTPGTVLRADSLDISGSVGRVELSSVLSEAQVARTWVARIWPREVAGAGIVHIQVAADAAQFDRLRGGSAESNDLAASTTAAGDIVVAPAAVQTLTVQGRRVVLAHELTHVVLGQTRRSGLPRWVVEGSAEFTAYRWAGLSLTAACPTLTTAVRAGRMPIGPPPEALFTDGSAQRAYQEAHAYMSFLVDRFGLTAWRNFVIETGKGSPTAFGDYFAAATPTSLGSADTAFLQRMVG